MTKSSKHVVIRVWGRGTEFLCTCGAHFSSEKDVNKPELHREKI